MNYNEEEVLKVLRSVFGYENFLNDTQRNAIATIIEGKQSVCISMPPGSGRSLCFQLPAIFQGKTAVIISSKLSSMKKQVNFLRSKHINAHLLYQKLFPDVKQSIINNLTSPSPTIQLLYVTVDMALIRRVENAILILQERNILSYIVYNEAHCLSTLGYDYVRLYERINMSRTMSDRVQRIAVTTTVTNEVIEDICKLLMIKPKIFKLAVPQTKVFYEIQFLDTLIDPFQHLISFITKTLGYLELSIQEIVQKGCAVIYCREEVTAELLKNKINAFGIPTLTCHYKMPYDILCNIEHKWISGDACVLTTTYNYGFIYRKLIRCTVYWTVPENISKYYRVSMQSHAYRGQTHCRVYFSTKEYLSVKTIIENKDRIKDVEHTKSRLIEYDKFVSYCLSVKCRHMLISQYFGYVTSPCKNYCDVCTNKPTVEATVIDFTRFSESIEGIKYNICEISGDPPNEETDYELLEMKNNNKWLVQCNDKISAKGTVYSTSTLEPLVNENNLRNETLNREISGDLPNEETDCEILEIKNNNKWLVQCNDKISAKGTVYSTSTLEPLVNENNLRNETLNREISGDLPNEETDCEILEIKNNNKWLMQCNDKISAKSTVYSTSTLQPLVNKNNLRNETLNREISGVLPNKYIDCKKSPIRDNANRIVQYNDETSAKDIICSTLTSQSLENKSNLRKETLNYEIKTVSPNKWVDCRKLEVNYNDKTSAKETMYSTSTLQSSEDKNNLRQLQYSNKTSAKDTIYSTCTSRSLADKNNLRNNAPDRRIRRISPDKWIDCRRSAINDDTKRIVHYNDKATAKDTVYRVSPSRSPMYKTNLKKEIVLPESDTLKRSVIERSVKRKNSIASPITKRVKALNINKIKTDGTSNLISNRKLRETMVSDIKWKGTHFRRKVDSDDESVIVIEDTRDKRTARHQSTFQFKNDSNVRKSRDDAIIENLMDKYNLNRQAITLEIRKK